MLRAVVVGALPAASSRVVLSSTETAAAVPFVAMPAQPVFEQVAPTVTVMVLRSPLSESGDDAKSAETLLVEM